MRRRFSLRLRGRPSAAALALRALAVVLALISWPGVLRAQEAASPWFTTEQGRVRLIAANPSVGSDETVWLGLQFELQPHWKIYWRSPGDAGYPPRLEWSGSQNLTGAAVAWPAPERFRVLGLETMGYENAVVLPITARLTKPGEALKLRAALQYLTCEIVCIPYETTLALDLPAAAAPQGATGFGALIARYRAKVPGDGSAAGLRLEGASLESGAKPVLTLALAANPPLDHPDAFVEGPDGVTFGAPVIVLDDPAHPLLKVRAFGTPEYLAALPNRDLVITVVDGNRTMETATVPAVAAPPPEFASLLPMMLTALIGGLILNLMPCVLPVLSLKLLGAVGHATGGSRALRRGFLATSAGILLSFLLLAGVMIALRGAGVSVGWGLQFQQPVFLAGMAALTTLFAANLWGWFEVPLPRFVADRAPNAPFEGSIAGNVATGAFATLLATPCSAPFLGTAIGFAFAGSSLDILVIFATLGLGLALPYLAVAVAPGVARWLPRPGRWMVLLRRILGAALVGTAAWLIFVLSAEASHRVALSVGAALAALLVSLGALEASRLRALGASLAIVVAVLAAAVGPASPEPPAPEGTDALWQPFDRARIAELVAEGKVVFVDVTARWCLTCQANKQFVLDQVQVRNRLAAPGTVAMAADWTRPDPIIAAYLKSYGRYGIPFNAVYGPSAPQGIALSELLTPGEVLSALERAHTPARAAGVAPQSPPSGG
ncbi:MAG TPA: protein-disulfide reductase DsbD domain-containing protein [Stellaceae bacterium]|nr:protein-disulfide reductase DsbD domain-containing protein [Stellaceae bacterium]